MTYLLLTSILLLFSFSSKAQSVEAGNYVGLQIGAGVLGSSLSGSGFNSTLPAKTGLLYGIDLSHGTASSDTRYHLKYDKASVSQSVPSGLTPSAVTIYREEIRFLATFLPWDSGVLENLRLGLGYCLLSTGATNTSPNNVLTQQSSQGLILDSSYTFKTGWDFLVLSELLVYLPYQLKESQQVTGYNPSYFGLEIKFNAEYEFSEKVIAYVGLGYRVDQVSFEGSATRGVSGGQDSRTFFSIPIGIKMSY